MIRTYELSADRRLVASRWASVTADGIDFIEALAPSKAEIGEMSERFHFPFDYLGGILDDYENARFETDEHGNTLLLLQYPAASQTGEIETYPYSLVATAAGSVVFSLNHEISLGPDFTRGYEDKRASHQMIYRIVSQLTSVYQQYLTDFRAKRHDVSANIRRSTKNDQLLEMIQMQASLVYFQDALDNNLEVLTQFIDYLRGAGEDGFAERMYDLFVETDQAKTESRIQAKLLENLRDLFSNIVANNLNIVMKIMTSATFVLGIPAVVVGFYGMNVPIPGQQLSWIVWVIFGSILVLCGLVTWWLRRRDMM